MQNNPSFRRHPLFPSSYSPVGGFGPRLPTRRAFLNACATGLCLLSAGEILALPGKAQAQSRRKGLIGAKLSPYFTRLSGTDIQCDLCPKRCRVADGGRGVCGVRENRNGSYYSLVYGTPCAVNLDPIEKKPFFHVLPSTGSFSLATAGCNFRCLFCQNWEISQVAPEEVFAYDFPPERIVAMAKEAGARSVAYTYVEPTVFFEYMLDTCRVARKAGLLNVCHSNGFISLVPLQDLCSVLDAANVDLKGFTAAFYRDLCAGELAPVLEALKRLKQNRVHLEITNLIIPSKNDDVATIREMCLWIKRELGADTPVHFSRFYPLYKLRALPPTPVAALERARAAALAAGLKFVYLGNIPGHEAENTFCPRCARLVIQRTGYMVGEVRLKNGACASCGQPIPGIWG
jgi:pyruvate formate lyase activating enzyme